MTAYEVLIGEILEVQAARDSLPRDTHIGTLCDFTVTRLLEDAETCILPRRNDLSNLSTRTGWR